MVTVKLFKILIFGLFSLPALWLLGQWGFYAMDAPHDLGFNPQEASNRFSGIWALRALIVALALGPVALMFRLTWPIQIRRMLGLFAFFYASLHLSSYLGLDLLGDMDAFWEDIKKRLYILFGLGAFLCLIPLALTSTKGWIKRLKARRWKQLHRLVYLAGILAALHYLYMAKGNQLEPKIYAAIITGLLLIRLWRLWPRIKRRTMKPIAQDITIKRDKAQARS
ncbi:protein-methionine-sulfoxide reductase heme-binding subunit MsrQ [Iodidimonas nitroreducens]|uniref:Protein-methionine-sulfoxide reductase heme-binding subunit MsrQ n=1 Tax=Iodidimonas nitroreducens TaxID=1236968 RepID=A0A5A7N8C3_9PROT|nr:protein-methionine-sulfoxide reductase heme-binding subunit MsrQ [Iodidimonas nitroreducens]